MLKVSRELNRIVTRNPIGAKMVWAVFAGTVGLGVPSANAWQADNGEDTTTVA